MRTGLTNNINFKIDVNFANCDASRQSAYVYYIDVIGWARNTETRYRNRIVGVYSYRGALAPYTFPTRPQLDASTLPQHPLTRSYTPKDNASADNQSLKYQHVH